MLGDRERRRSGEGGVWLRGHNFNLTKMTVDLKSFLHDRI